MMVLIGRAGVPRSLRRPAPGDRRRSAPAPWRPFIAYGGSYGVDGGTVSHRVAMSLFPNWVGSVQRRYAAFDESGDVLTLTSDPILVRGSQRSQRLVWERVRRP
jgi:hypothetical protein